MFRIQQRTKNKAARVSPNTIIRAKLLAQKYNLSQKEVIDCATEFFFEAAKNNAELKSLEDFLTNCLDSYKK